MVLSDHTTPAPALQVLDVHNGKQTCDTNSSPENWSALDAALNAAYTAYYDTLTAAQARSVLCRLVNDGYLLGGACWARFVDGKWYPAKLMNRFDLRQQLSAELLRSGEGKAMVEGDHSRCVPAAGSNEFAWLEDFSPPPTWS